MYAELANAIPRNGKRKIIKPPSPQKTKKLQEKAQSKNVAFIRGPRMLQKKDNEQDTAVPKQSTSNTTNVDAANAAALQQQHQYTKYLGSFLKLDNNQITSLQPLLQVLPQVMETPTHLTFLDLSFNHIAHLDVQWPDTLETLYLHSNSIADMKQVAKLSPLKLRTLTLHGNPIQQNIKNYRFHVLCLVPQLKSLDFSTVTPQDRDTAKTFKTIFLKS